MIGGCSPHANPPFPPSSSPSSLSVPFPHPYTPYITPLPPNSSSLSHHHITNLNPHQIHRPNSDRSSSPIPPVQRRVMRREGSEIMVPRHPSSSSYSSSSMENDSGFLVERPVTSLPPDRKGRIPKKVHKAEREKLKRDHLNELFQELGQALEPSQQNNGKASILGDATKLLRDLISQVDSLRRENAALQKESRYVAVERNELKDENAALGAEIEKLQIEIRSRMHSNPSWSNAAHTSPAQPLSTTLTIQQPPMVGSMYVVPVQSDQPYVELSDPTAHIRRPHARYPTPADSWPYRILSQHPAVGSDDGSCATGDEESGEVPSSPKELLLLI